MHIVENKSKLGKKIYHSILLRESYREDKKVKNRTIANLSNCTPQEISTIKLALNHKGDLGTLGSLSESIKLKEGLSVGAIGCMSQVAMELEASKLEYLRSPLRAGYLVEKPVPMHVQGSNPYVRKEHTHREVT